MAAEATPLTVVLVPGAWTAPVAYQKLVNILETKHFTVHIPALPTNDGHRPPTRLSMMMFKLCAKL
ncbi:alpha/beta-hydrolase [Apiospora arundinis]